MVDRKQIQGKRGPFWITNVYSTDAKRYSTTDVDWSKDWQKDDTITADVVVKERTDAEGKVWKNLWIYKPKGNVAQSDSTQPSLKYTTNLDQSEKLDQILIVLKDIRDAITSQKGGASEQDTPTDSDIKEVFG